MEKGLLIKVLGKADAVRLEDQIYNLRDITNKVRYGLMGNMSIFDDNFIADVVKELEGINEVIKEIKINVEDPNKIGYTNSREYLKKYLESISHNIIELIKNLNPFNEKLVIMHNNLLCDCLLKY